MAFRRRRRGHRGRRARRRSSVGLRKRLRDLRIGFRM